MGALLGLLAAICYGGSDFAGGVGGRRASSSAVAIMAQPFGLLAGVLAVLLTQPPSPTAAVIGWGVVSGIGNGVGALALYRGFTIGQISVVAPLSAVLAAALPAGVGLAGGDQVTALQACGLLLALPAIALVTREPGAGRFTRAGILEGVVAGIGFALLFIALDRAGTDSGAWPTVPAEVAAVVCVVALGLASGDATGTWRAAWWPAVITGVLGGLGTLLFLAATGAGELAIVAVLTSLYPAVTIVLARGFLDERWSGAQQVGLAVCGCAIVLIGLG